MQISVRTEKKKQIIDITDDIAQLIQEYEVTEGICVLFVKHTTASLTTADLDPGTDLDMLDAFDRIIPQLRYRHPHNPAHVPDHILSSIIGPSVSIPFEDGALLLGTWQRIILVELDGARDRDIIVSFIPLES